MDFDLEMTDDELRKRVLALLFDRLAEIAAPDGAIDRRPKLLSPHAALDELVELAHGHVRSGGATKSGEAPEHAGHGVKHLPEVIAEAIHALEKDPVIRDTELAKALVAAAKPLSAPTLALVERSRALVASLRARYLTSAAALLRKTALQEPRKFLLLESALDSLVAELRYVGWTDPSFALVLTKAKGAEDPLEALLTGLEAMCTQKSHVFDCYVPADLGPYATNLPVELQGVAPVSELPSAEKGSFLRVTVTGKDPSAVAAIARLRAATLLNGASVFMDYPIRVTEPEVRVVVETDIVKIDPIAPLRRDPHRAVAGQIERIMTSIWASGKRSAEPLADALRLHQRAIETDDDESQFMLLWFAIERLIAGSVDHSGDGPGIAAKALIPKAIVLGQIRRDVSSLCDSLMMTLPGDVKDKMLVIAGGQREHDNEPWLMRDKVLAFVLAGEAEFRRFLAPFYADHPLLVQRCFSLRKTLWGDDGKQIPKNLAGYLRDRCTALEWNVLRLYRARNGAVHVASRPVFIRDLAHQAHFLLTNMIALAVQYRESAPSASSASVYAARCGRFDAYLDLLESGDKAALDPGVMIRPTTLFPS